MKARKVEAARRLRGLRGAVFRHGPLGESQWKDLRGWLDGLVRGLGQGDADATSSETPAQQALAAGLGRLLDQLGVLEIVLFDGTVFCNEEPCGSAAEYARLGAALAAAGLVGLRFQRPIPPTIGSELVSYLNRYTAAAGHDEIGTLSPSYALLAARQRSDLSTLTGHRAQPAEEPALNATALAALPELALGVVDEAYDDAGAGWPVDTLRLRHVVGALLGSGIDNIFFWDELRGHSPLARHGVAVMRVSLAIGEALGLERFQLENLGMAAALHDLGYAVDPAVEGLAAHLSAGVAALLRAPGYYPGLTAQLLGVLYHHHRAADLRQLPSLFARIIRLADDFDTLSQARAGGLSPTLALERMLSATPGQYDPQLLQLMVNRLGRYPPPTRLRLEDGTVVRSASLVRGKNFDKPLARTEDGRLVDLSRAVRVVEVI